MDNLMKLKQIFFNILKAAGVLLALFLICLVSILVILWMASLGKTMTSCMAGPLVKPPVQRLPVINIRRKE